MSDYSKQEEIQVQKCSFANLHKIALKCVFIVSDFQNLTPDHKMLFKGNWFSQKSNCI
jgi:hypothetical protein